MKRPTIKCLVWDLDETLWEGVLLEGGGRRLKPGVWEAVQELDRRGILQSIASRNDHEAAMTRLEDFGLAEYFLYPQIHFGPKSGSLKTIAEKLNISLDAFAFIDDQAFERTEVESVHPQVRVFSERELVFLTKLPCFSPRFITEDSARRRLMYQTDQARSQAEENFQGPSEAFLADLNLTFTLDRVGPGDLERAVDLTERTHQLNATGLTFDHDQLAALMDSPKHHLVINSLSDRFGDYGRIGLSLMEKAGERWILKLLLMSCRVMSRGVGSAMLNIWIRHALAAGRELYADFAETDRNRIMYVTYCFAGFEEAERFGGGKVLLKRPLTPPPTMPPYLKVASSMEGFAF